MYRGVCVISVNIDIILMHFFHKGQTLALVYFQQQLPIPKIERYIKPFCHGYIIKSVSYCSSDRYNFLLLALRTHLVMFLWLMDSSWTPLSNHYS